MFVSVYMPVCVYGWKSMERLRLKSESQDKEDD